MIDMKCRTVYRVEAIVIEKERETLRLCGGGWMWHFEIGIDRDSRAIQDFRAIGGFIQIANARVKFAPVK